MMDSGEGHANRALLPECRKKQRGCAGAEPLPSR